MGDWRQQAAKQRSARRLLHTHRTRRDLRPPARHLPRGMHMFKLPGTEDAWHTCCGFESKSIE